MNSTFPRKGNRFCIIRMFLSKETGYALTHILTKLCRETGTLYTAYQCSCCGTGYDGVLAVSHFGKYMVAERPLDPETLLLGNPKRTEVGVQRGPHCGVECSEQKCGRSLVHSRRDEQRQHNTCDVTYYTSFNTKILSSRTTRMAMECVRPREVCQAQDTRCRLVTHGNRAERSWSRLVGG